MLPILRLGNAMTYFMPHELTRIGHDSWEKLEEDAEKLACDYFVVECDSEERCRRCPHFQRGATAQSICRPTSCAARRCLRRWLAVKVSSARDVCPRRGRHSEFSTVKTRETWRNRFSAQNWRVTCLSCGATSRRLRANTAT